MPRFNLLFHGMMLFVEDDENVQVSIPTVGDHVYKHGLPAAFRVGGDSGCRAGTGIKDLPANSNYVVAGPRPAARKLLSLVSPTTQVCLRAEKVNVSLGGARNRLTVPMPDLIRVFRVAEVLNLDVRGQTDPSVFVTRPYCISEIVCFSYINIACQTEISIGDLFRINIGNEGANYCFYAQSITDDPHQQGVHPTALNDLLSVKGGRQTDLMLSHVGLMDGAPEPAEGTGLTKCMLSNLFELNNFHNRFGGCGAAFVLDMSREAVESLERC